VVCPVVVVGPVVVCSVVVCSVVVCSVVVCSVGVSPAANLPSETADTIAVPLTGLDGREFGVITLVDKRRGAFSELDEAVLAQLAQMASAAVERTQLYLRSGS